jgi:hypothetical protein
MTNVTKPRADIPIAFAEINGRRIACETNPEFTRFFEDLMRRAGGTTGTDTSTINSVLHALIDESSQVPSSALQAWAVAYSASAAGVGRDLESKLREAVSVLDYGAKGDGTTDDTAAFVAALAVGRPVYLPQPSVAYIVGDCAVPSGSQIFACGAANYSSIVGGPVVRRKAGCTSVFTIDGAKNIRLAGFTVDGVDQTCHGVTGNSSSGHMLLDHMDFRSLDYGIGDNSGYIHTVKSIHSNFVLCNTGIRNPVDSIFVGGYIAANDNHGVFAGTGANDNTFVGCKVEWNLQNGYRFDDSEDNNIIGGILDRNYELGVMLNGTSKRITISGVVLRRNGRTDTTAKWAHIRLNDSVSNVTISGCVTKTGQDDGGVGTVTPQYGIDIASASVDSITITGNDLTGVTTTGGGLRNVVSSTNIKATGNLGAQDVHIVQSITSSAGTDVLDTTIDEIVVTGTTTHTLTLPACRTGRRFRMTNRSTGTVTVNRAGSDTINGAAGGLSVTTGQIAELLGHGNTDWVGKAY